jgi:cell wall assembly regulator SMI1
MSPIADAWRRIDSWFSSHSPEGPGVLKGGAAEEQIRQLERTIKLSLPEDLKESCRLHNGSDRGRGLFSDGSYLLSLDEIAKAWQRCCDVYGEDEESDEPSSGPIKDLIWNKKWIPITDSGAGDHYCVDLDPGEGGIVGQIIDRSHEEGPVGVVGPSLAAWLSAFADALEGTA